MRYRTRLLSSRPIFVLFLAVSLPARGQTPLPDINAILSRIGGSTPKTSVFPTGAQTFTTATFVSSQSGTAQILIAGITPTSQSGLLYSLLLNGAPVLQHQTVGPDTTLYYEGPAGTYQVVPEAFAISQVTLPTAIIGSPFSQTVSAAGGVPPYTWSASLPTGLSLNASTGTISGTPTASGTVSIALRVADAAAHTATLTVPLTVASKLISNSAFPDLSATAGSPLHSPALVAGGIPPYTCSASSALPAGVSLNAATCRLTGTPTAPGTWPVTASASDSGVPAQTAALSFSGWSIANPLEITSRTASALKAAGGYPPYSNWAVASGTLPPGWALNAASGAVSGSSASAATTFAVTVQDSAGNVSPPRSFSTAPLTTPSVTLAAGASFLTANLTPPSVTGSVTFFDGTAILGTSSVMSGAATLTARMLLPGSHSLRAEYWPDVSAVVPCVVPANPQNGLATPATYTTDAVPLNAVTGDFNSDGKPDLAIATANGFDLLTGNGDGTFQNEVHTASPAGYLAAGDFNGDGNLDIAIAESGQPFVAILLGTGAGAFGAAVPLRIASSAQQISIADFNGDGVPDLAVLDATGVSILLGNGDGTFYLNGHIGSSSSGLAIADFNADGVADLALSTSAGSVQILNGNGDGTFQTGSTYAGAPGQITTADFNADGLTDIATATGVLLGRPNGAFAAIQSYPGAITGTPIAADFNGDGKPDLALVTTSGITLLIGNGDGTFTARSAPGAGGAYALAADFNADARTDLAVVNAASNSVAVSLGLSPLTITCAPAAGPVTTGTVWSAACSASGGATPYTWSIGSGALPAGLTLNTTSGSIVGTPTAAGAYSFTVKAADSGSPVQTATQSYAGTLTAPVSAPISSPVTAPLSGGGGGGAVIPSGSTLTASTAALTFHASPGSLPAPQTISFSSAIANTTFTANAVTNGGVWLSISPASGATDSQGQVTVTANPAGLGQGAYTGTVNVTTSAGGIASVAISFNVQAQLTAVPNVVSFVYYLGGVTPPAQTLSVFSNPAGASIAIGPRQNPGERWLDVIAAGAAPLSTAVSVNPASLAAGTYTATAAISSPSAPAVNVPVTLTVVSDQPKLDVSPPIQTFTLTQGSSPRPAQIVVSNTGGGTLPFTASTSSNWLKLAGAASGSATAGAPVPVPFSVNPAGLSPGHYTAWIDIAAAGLEPASARVTLFVSRAGSSVILSQTALTFSTIAGGPRPPVQTVFTNGTAQSAVPWLSISQTGASVLSFSADPTGLSPGQYFGLVNVSSDGSVNSPQSIAVVLNVAPSAQTGSAISLSPGGMLSVTGSPQQVTLHNASNAPVNYSSTAGNWLTLAGPTGSLPPGDTSLPISSNPANLSGVLPGVQWGRIQFAFDNGQVASVNMAALPGASAACSPTSLTPVFRQPSDQSSLQAGMAQRVQIKIVDDCGNPLTSAQGAAAQVLFDSGDPLLTLVDTGNGVWEGTWTPMASGSPVALQAVASQQTPGLASVASPVSVTVQPAAANAPAQVSGIVNAAGSGQAEPGIVAPGAYVAIYGSGLAGAGAPLASSIPLPTTLNGAQVLLGNRPMPLLYAGPNQINALIPQGLDPNTSWPLVIQANGTISAPAPVAVDAVQPAIYTQDLSGTGQGIVEIAGTTLLASPDPSVGRPAQRASDYLVIFATGLGPVTGSNGETPPSDGAGAQLTTVYQVTSPVTATLGGVDAPVVFAGLTPSLVGLYQVNVQVPPGAPAGAAVPLFVSVSGVPSNSVTVAIQ